MGRATQSGRYWLSCSISDGRFGPLPGMREPPETGGNRPQGAPLPSVPAFLSRARPSAPLYRAVQEERGGEAPRASGFYPELDLRLTERARRRRVPGRGAVGPIDGVPGRGPADGSETELPGVISVDPTSGEVRIDLRTVEERARSIDLVT